MSKPRTMRADQLKPGDTIHGQGTVDTVYAAHSGDIVVTFTNRDERRFVPKDSLTVTRG